MARKKFRPIRAVNADLAKIKYPIAVLPKIDGVRGLNPFGTLLTRTLALMPNVHTRELFSHQHFMGMDGELAAGLETDDDLCRKSTSACMSRDGTPTVTWHVFDLCAEAVCDKGYVERYNMLKGYIDFEHECGRLSDVQVVPLEIVNNEQELLEWYEIWLNMGYEGMIGRKIDGKYKWGTATVNEGFYIRFKPYEDTEGTLEDVIEAEENLNEAFEDARGYTKRSTHQENKVGKGMAGALVVKRLDNGELARIGPGKLTHPERIDLWNKWKSGEIKPGELIAKFRHFPKGVLVKPRQARFLSWRSKDDILPKDDE